MEKIQILVLFNNQRLDPTQFGDTSVVNEAKLFKQQISETEPNYVKFDVQMNTLDDETSYLQWGQTEESEYLNMIMSEPGVSSWNDNLIDNPDGRYKFNSMEINFS